MPTFFIPSLLLVAHYNHNRKDGTQNIIYILTDDSLLMSSDILWLSRMKYRSHEQTHSSCGITIDDDRSIDHTSTLTHHVVLL